MPSSPQLGPENTLFAFRQSAKYDIFGFEGDVSIR